MARAAVVNEDLAQVQPDAQLGPFRTTAAYWACSLAARDRSLNMQLVIPDPAAAWVHYLQSLNEKALRGAWDEVLLQLPRQLGPRLVRRWWRDGCLTLEELRHIWPEAWSNAEVESARPMWATIWRQAARAGRIEQEDHPLPTDDLLTVYRGQQSADHRLGISWTLREDVAVRFARPRPGFDGPGVVFTGLVRRRHVLGYLTYRAEDEVIVERRHVSVTSTRELPEADRPEPR
jgi:hypothetical protein